MSVQDTDFSQELPGGELPAVTELFASVIEDIGKDLGGYALAGLGHFLVTIVAVFIFIPLMYISIALGGAVGMAGGGVVGVGIGGLISSDAAGGLGALFMTLGMVLGVFVPVFGLATLMTVAIAPMRASLDRAVVAKQRYNEPLTISAAFSTYATNLLAVGGVILLLTALSILGLLACYFPALLVGIPFSFAFTLVSLHGCGPLEAMKLSFAHFRAHPKWHLGYWGLGLAAALIGGNIPVIGIMVPIIYFTKGHRLVFGDGDEPNVVL